MVASPKRIRGVKDVAKEVRKEVEARRRDPKIVYGYAGYGRPHEIIKLNEDRTYPATYRKLNMITGGIQKNRMQLLIARMKIGKSMIAAGLIPGVGEQAQAAGKVVRVASLEMDQVAYLKRMASMMARVPNPTRRIEQGDWVGAEDAYDRFEQAMDYLTDLPIEFNNGPLNTRDLEAWVAGKYGEYKGVESYWWVLDHFGLLTNNNGSNASYQNLVGAANDVMEICHAICTGLIVGHANRLSGNGIPSQDNIAGTDQLGKNFDELWALARPFAEKTAQELEALGLTEDDLAEGEPAILRITSRHTEGGTVWLWWMRGDARFVEMKEEDAEDASITVGKHLDGTKKQKGK